jgi:hypothetical protein
MITEKHYTNKNEHPEDRIYAVKKFINELSNVQDFYFNQLFLELNLKEEASDYLFDYIFNETEPVEFDEYLEKLNKNYKDFYNG